MVDHKTEKRIETIEKHLKDKEELIKIHGEHVSHLRADTTKNTVAIMAVEGMIKELSNTTEKQYDKVMAVLEKQNVVLEKIQPVIKKFEDDLVVAQADKMRYEMYVKTGTAVITTGVIGSGLLWLFKFLRNTII